jgi:hypothetical protein
MLAKVSILLSGVAFGTLGLILAHEIWHVFSWEIMLSGALTLWGGFVPCLLGMFLSGGDSLWNGRSRIRFCACVCSAVVFLSWILTMYYASRPA